MRRWGPQRIATLVTGGALRVRGCELVALEVHRGWVAGVACRAHGDAARPPGASPGTGDPPGLGARGPQPRSVPTRRGCCLQRRGPWARRLARQLQAVLVDPGCPPALRTRVLTRLATSPEPAVRVASARERGCPPETLAALGTDPWWEVRAAVVSNPGCPTATLRSLAGDRTLWVRRALAESRLGDRSTFQVLAGDPDAGIRDAVAENPRCPADLLAQLARDPVWEIRRSLAKRADTPPVVLAGLAADPVHWVRFFVARHPATPSEVLRALHADPRPLVRAAARSRGARADQSGLAGG